MKNQPFQPATYYHVFNRGNNRENLFIETENYAYFLRLMKKYLNPIAEFHSYCLLPNHFHLVLKTKEEQELPDKIKTGQKGLHQPFSNLFNAYTKAINKRYGRRGSLFQEHLKRKPIDDEEYFKNLIIYVNINPSHHQISDYKNYKYSSYLDLISDYPSFLLRKFVLGLFDDVENFKFVLEERKITVGNNEKFQFED